jgi:glycerophosphoryl diester phosphodiesterase
MKTLVFSELRNKTAIIILALLAFSVSYAQEKPVIVTHAMGFLASPGNSMESLELNVANHINVDIDLRPSKDGELVLAHDEVYDRNYWGDMERTPVKLRDGFNKEQFSGATYKRFDDMLDYIVEHKADILMHVELKDHTPELTQIAIDKIYSHGLIDKSALWVLDMDEVDMVRKLDHGKDIKVYVWCDVYPERIFKAISPENRTKIDGTGMYFKYNYYTKDSVAYSTREILDTIHSAGLKFALVYMDDEAAFEKLTDMDFVYAEKPDLVMGYPAFNRIPKPVIKTPVSIDNASRTVRLETMVWDTDSSIKKIEFYANGKKIGEDTTVPYDLTWKAGPGRYLITARSYDKGKTIDSDDVIIEIN